MTSHDTNTLQGSEGRLMPLTLVLLVVCTAADVWLLAKSATSMSLLIWLIFALPCFILIASNLFCLSRSGPNIGMIPVALASLCPAAVLGACISKAYSPTWWLFTIVAVLTLAMSFYFASWFRRMLETCLHSSSVADDAVVIVLGGFVKNGQPVKTVANRLDVAAQLWRESPSRVIVTTGGTTPDGSTTEAAVMSRWLQEKEGVPASSILLESKAINTEDNVRRSLALVRERGLDDSQLCIVSSDYHLYRAKALAHEYGANVTCIPSEVPPASRLQQWCREVLVILVRGVK